MLPDGVLKCLVCVPLRRAFLTCLLAVIWSAGPVLASPEVVVFKQGDQESRVKVTELPNRADVRFTFFDPYLAEEVEVTGLVFRDLLEEFLKAGHDVNVTDNLSNGHAETIARVGRITSRTRPPIVADRGLTGALTTGIFA